MRTTLNTILRAAARSLSLLAITAVLAASPAHAADSDVFLNLGEQFALSRVHGHWSNADNSALKIRGPNGAVVAYIDSQGSLRHKGMVFENWTGWSYWD